MMQKTILITGATDGIGLATATTLVQAGHRVLVHGRSGEKLRAVEGQLNKLASSHLIDTFCADLADFQQVKKLADEVKSQHQTLDVLINNAGVFKVAKTQRYDGLDMRFVVNTFAPYLLTKLLMPSLSERGRVVNLSSAAQSGFEPEELVSARALSDSAAYAKSKLALTMWSRYLANGFQNTPKVMVAVNPASLLGSKMVKEAYGVAGGDVQRGADILVQAALSADFDQANGLYFDNDVGEFAAPHPDALDENKIKALIDVLERTFASEY